MFFSLQFPAQRWVSGCVVDRPPRKPVGHGVIAETYIFSTEIRVTVFQGAWVTLIRTDGVQLLLTRESRSAAIQRAPHRGSEFIHAYFIYADRMILFLKGSAVGSWVSSHLRGCGFEFHPFCVWSCNLVLFWIDGLLFICVKGNVCVYFTAELGPGNLRVCRRNSSSIWISGSTSQYRTGS